MVPSKPVQRRLAAILAADVVGYSRLMAADEAGTLNALKDLRKTLVEPEIARNGGRMVKLMGDGALVEFPSAVGAMECAVAIQRAMAERNAGIPVAERIVFRIGLNVGDVIIEGSDIYGNGVNIASRLEGQAQPGGICLSATVHEQVLGKVAVDFVDMGEINVKNIDRPVRAFATLPGRVAAEPRGAGESQPHPAAEKPSIAILPLVNMSGDPEQEYFADGISEDLITELSRFQGLAVIARNSSFTYKGRAVRVQDVGRELGVDFVVEGSVRKAASRVRVTVQLIDADTGAHLWAERYDRELEDIFALQDELVQAIVATISGRLESAIAGRIKSKPPSDLNAYDLVIRAKLCHHRGTREDNAQAVEMLEKAITLDPGFASAYAWRVCVMGQAWARGYRPFTQEDLKLGLSLLHRSLLEDENDLECLRILCEYYMEQRQFEPAARYHEKAFRLNPNDPRIVAQRGELMTWRGQAEEAVGWIERAIRLDPFSADAVAHLLGRALFGARRYDEALAAFRRVPEPRLPVLAFMAASAAKAGKKQEAEDLAAHIRALRSGVAADGFAAGLTYERDEDRRHLADALAAAGLAR